MDFEKALSEGKIIKSSLVRSKNLSKTIGRRIGENHLFFIGDPLRGTLPQRPCLLRINAQECVHHGWISPPGFAADAEHPRGGNFAGNREAEGGIVSTHQGV